MLGSESGHWLAWQICWHSFLSGEKGCTFLKVKIINCWNNRSTSAFLSTSNSNSRMYIFLRNASGFPLSSIFGSPEACTTWKMDDPDGPSCFGASQTCLDAWALGLVLFLAGEEGGGEDSLDMGSPPGGMCTVELEICISDHITQWITCELVGNLGSWKAPGVSNHWLKCELQCPRASDCIGWSRHRIKGADKVGFTWDSPSPWGLEGGICCVGTLLHAGVQCPGGSSPPCWAEAGQAEESSKKGTAMWEGRTWGTCGSWYPTDNGLCLSLGAVLALATGIWAPRGRASLLWLCWEGSRALLYGPLAHLRTREIFNFEARSYFLFKIQTDRDGCWPQQHYLTLSTTQIFSWGFLLERQALGCKGERGGDAEVWTHPPTLGRGGWWGTQGAPCGWLGEAKGASSRGKQLPKARVEMLNKSLECDLERLLKCFAEGGPSRGKSHWANHSV